MCAATEGVRPSGAPARRALGQPRRGLTLVELMVGMVVGLLVSLAAASSVRLFTASQRQSVGVGAVGVNAMTAIAALKNDVSNAGLGFFGQSTFMCPTLNLGVGANLISDGASFTPVQGRRVGLNDVLEVVYGTDVSSGAAVNATSPDALSAAVESFLPASVNQSLLIAPEGVVAPCTVRSITAVTPATPVLKQVLALDAGGTYNQAAFTNVPAYPLNSRVALLGNLQWNRYAVDNNGNLVLTRVLDGRSAILLRNVMGFRVEYGTSSAASGGSMLDSWRATTDAGWAAIDQTNIGWVRALRGGVVVRSAQREKPNANGVCEASSAKPQLFGKVIEPDVVDWQCYRYRSAVFLAPLRNIVYGLKAP